MEDRTLLAFDLTLSTGGTSNVIASNASGTTTFTATATGATLSWLDVGSALMAGNSVVITSGSGGTEAGNIIDQTGMQFPSLTTPNLKLTIQSGTGTGLVGNIRIDGINLGGPTSSIVLNAQGNLSTGSGGSFGHPAQLSSATLIAATGSVTSLSSPLPGPIEATTLAIQAGTGIGTSTAPLQTQVSNLSASTPSGGIFISNTGNLNITGGVIAGVNGIQDSTSGDIVLTNAGNLTATTNGDTLHGQYNASITTTAFGDILLGGDNGGGFDMAAGTLVSREGKVVLNAARNLLIGNTADPVFGSSNANIFGLGITLTAGGDIIDANSLVQSITGGGVGITATAGGNISVLSDHTSPTLFVTWGGSMALSTGSGGTILLKGELNTSEGDGWGNISISADHVVLDPTSEIVAYTATVSIQPVTASESIQLGTTTDAELDLSNAELATINASTLQVGSLTDSGNVTVTAAINRPAYTTLSLQTGGAVADAAPADTTTVSGLAAIAGAGISLDTALTYLAFRNTSAGDVRIANAGGLTVLAVDTVAGTHGYQTGNFAPGGTVSLSVGNSNTGNTLAVNAPMSASGGATLNGGSGNDTFQFNFSSGASLPTPLTINSGGGKDLIALKYTTGNPLPAEIHLNGLFTITGLIGNNPFANTTVDIGASTVWLSYAASAYPITAIQSDIANGYDNGAWNGTPSGMLGVITSSAAQSDPLQNTAIGYVDSADGTGVNPVANTIELKYTVYGDSNLDGTANLADLLSLVRHFGAPGGWDAGDFNYDGTTNLADFLIVTRHFGQSVQASTAQVDTILAGSAPTTIARAPLRRMLS